MSVSARLSVEPPSVIQSVDRALRLLWELDNPNGLTLTELAARTGLLPTTAGRLLSTLERHALVERDPVTREYHVGLGALELSRRVTDRLDLRRRLQPLVYGLAEQVQQNVSLTILDRSEVFHLLDVDGAEAAGHLLLLRSQEGRRDAALNATAAGKVLLAHQPEAEQERLIAGLDFRRTAPRTITDPQQLRDCLALVRRQGYGTSVEENSPFTIGAAAPIRDHTGHVVAALAVHGPVARLSEARLLSFTASLLAAAMQASAALGYRQRAEDAATDRDDGHLAPGL